MLISKLKAGSLGQSSVTSDNIVDGTIVNADISFIDCDSKCKSYLNIGTLNVLQHCVLV